MNLRGQLQTALGSAYRLERELGQGGMSTVFLAEDLKHNRGVAVKVLRRELRYPQPDADTLRQVSSRPTGPALGGRGGVGV